MRRDPLASLLPRTALTINGETNVRMRDGDYEFEAHGGLTRVDGEAPAIDRLQRAAARYLQRPDADYLPPYDPLRTTMSGAKLGATFRRRNARHWLWEVGTETESPELEMNDVGRFNTGDGTVVTGEPGVSRDRAGAVVPRLLVRYEHARTNGISAAKCK